MFNLLSELTVLLHFLFIVWVAVGVFFLKRHPRLRMVHLACVLWGLAIEVQPWICPLTHLESWLRTQAGAPTYQQGFIPHYLEKLVYVDAPRWALILAAALVLAYTLGLNARWGFARPGPAGGDTLAKSG